GRPPAFAWRTGTATADQTSSPAASSDTRRAAPAPGTRRCGSTFAAVAETRISPGRTLIWPLMSTGAPRTAEDFFSFRGVTTGPLLAAPLLTAPRASAEGVSTKLHQTLIQGSATEPLGASRRLRGLAPRPRNSSVPPRRPLKPLGSRPRGRSPLGTGSAGGQPRGEGSTAPVPDEESEGRSPCRGPIQTRGAGTAAQRCLTGSVVPRHWQRRRALARCSPQFGQ